MGALQSAGGVADRVPQRKAAAPGPSDVQAFNGGKRALILASLPASRIGFRNECVTWRPAPGTSWACFLTPVNVTRKDRPRGRLRHYRTQSPFKMRHCRTTMTLVGKLLRPYEALAGFEMILSLRFATSN